MKFFVNDRKVRIKSSDQTLDPKDYDQVIADHEGLEKEPLAGKVWICDAQPIHLMQFLRRMEAGDLPKLRSITFTVADRDAAEQYVRDQFRLVMAGGGLVERDGKLLLIYRRDIWDLPKGKVEKEESVAEGARREVEEETGARVEILSHFAKTLHTYLEDGGRWTLKETHWYRMACIDARRLKPGTGEQIEKVEFVPLDQVLEHMKDSFRSMRQLVRKYLKGEPASSR